MSNSINNIISDTGGPISVSPIPSGNTQSISDNTPITLSTVATTAYVNSSYLTYISLTGTNAINAVLTFTGSIVTSLLRGSAGILSFSPTNLNLGRSGGTTTFLGTNPFPTNFPYWVSSGSLHREFFGVVTTSTLNNTDFFYPTANVFSVGPVAVASPVANGIAQTQRVQVDSFRPIFNAGSGVNVIIAGY